VKYIMIFYGSGELRDSIPAEEWATQIATPAE
jgi:hypothetical protein